MNNNNSFLRAMWKKQMPRILISTSCRYKPYDQPSGHLFVFDLDKQKIIRQSEIIEPPYREVDPNPRGGFRGLKGISIDGHRLAIANASTVFVYDHLWNPITYMWHPRCAGIHDIELINDTVWVTSSRNDLMICLDFNGEIIDYYNLRESTPVKMTLTRQMKSLLRDEQIINGHWDFRDPRTHDMAITDSLHINSMSFLDNGDLLVSCGLFRVIKDRKLHEINNYLKKNPLTRSVPKIYHKIKGTNKDDHRKNFEAMPISFNESTSLLLRISKEGRHSNSLKLTGCRFPSHSIRILHDNSAIYLNTSSGHILHFNPVTDQLYSSTHIGKTFLRGARQLPDNTLLIGDNNEMIHYDMNGKQIISRTLICKDKSEAIFDINILPEDFGLPPLSFSELHKQKLKVHQT